MIPEKQKEAKDAYLTKQLNQSLAQYHNADEKELKEAIISIQSILPTVNDNDSRIFWLRFQYQLERIAEKKKGLESTTSLNLTLLANSLKRINQNNDNK